MNYTVKGTITYKWTRDMDAASRERAEKQVLALIREGGLDEFEIEEMTDLTVKSVTVSENE